MAYSLSEKIRALAKLAAEPQVLSALLSQRIFGLLLEEGWFESYKTKTPLDKEGNPIPWTTYSFIDFIRTRLKSSQNVFEYGSGYSTLFFAPRVSSVTSCEHDKNWYQDMKRKIPTNCALIFAEDEAYEKSIAGTGTQYDIIFVDGIRRNECISSALPFLTKEGVIVLDDSERPEYEDGRKVLTDAGFKYIDFYGIAPGILFKKSTTVFYRPDNTLQI